MKITQDIIDNGMKIVHINYTKNDIKKIEKEFALKENELKDTQIENHIQQ